MIGFDPRAHEHAQWERQFAEHRAAQSAAGAQEALRLARLLREHVEKHNLVGWTFDGIRVPPRHPGIDAISPH